ncbi:unnamed protein product [Notodromas monacha]|uniref:Methyltransferase FkbM domain-containing protein n=1 Tax=Notodromas monacha TaxID=399045 RepID=A0A7R9BJW3_9CRUS|nr:unnamed protein product [Notodromas monacha]CAG0916867.1 unnamed protein product [Notodromas monacha]
MNLYYSCSYFCLFVWIRLRTRITNNSISIRTRKVKSMKCTKHDSIIFMRLKRVAMRRFLNAPSCLKSSLGLCCLAIITLLLLVNDPGCWCSRENCQQSYPLVCNHEEFFIQDFDQSFGRNRTYDDLLVDHIRETFLWPPSEDDYNLENDPRKVRSADKNEENPANRFVKNVIMKELFPNKYNGVFFEAGALDGETLSCSLYFEVVRNWTGLLVEMNPLAMERLISKNRKAQIAPVCLSTTAIPQKMPMTMRYDPKFPYTMWGASVNGLVRNHLRYHVKPQNFLEVTAIVDCYPLPAVLAAANISSIDLFALDLEGVELQVLKTIDWKAVTIKVIILDLIHTEEGPAEVQRFLHRKGFRQVYGDWEPVIFVSKQYLHTLRKRQGFLTIEGVSAEWKGPSKATFKNECEAIFKVFSRGLISIATVLHRTKEVRDFFPTIMEKVLEPLRGMKWNEEQLECFLTCYVAAGMKLDLAKKRHLQDREQRTMREKLMDTIHEYDEDMYPRAALRLKKCAFLEVREKLSIASVCSQSAL